MKYSLTKNTKQVDGRILFQIKAEMKIKKLLKKH